MKEGKCGEHYFQVSESLEVSREDEKSFRWVPWEERRRWFGEKEAKSRVALGTIAVRKCAADDRFFEFLLVSEGMKLSSKQRRVFETARKAKLSRAEYKNLAQGVMGEQDPQTLNDLMNLAEPATMASLRTCGRRRRTTKTTTRTRTTSNTPSLPEDLKRLVEGDARDKGKHTDKGKDKNKGVSKFFEKVDKLSQVGDDTTVQIALDKCAQMHSLVSKQVQDVRRLSAEKTRAKKVHAEFGDEVSGAVKELQKDLEALDKAVVECKGTAKQFKSLLVSTAKASKKVDATHKKLKDLK